MTAQQYKAARAFQHTVTDSALAIPKGHSKSIVIKVPSGGATVYLGGSDVDTTDGWPLEAGESLSLDFNLFQGKLYAIVASGTQVIQVLVLA